MTLLTFQIKETNNLILYPIAKQLINNILNRLGIRDEFGANNIIINTGFTAINNTDDVGGNLMIPTNTVEVDLNYQLNQDSQMWDTSVNYNTPAYGLYNTGYTVPSRNTGGTSIQGKNSPAQHPLIFSDLDSDVFLSEYTQPAGMTMEIKFKVLSFEIAQLIFSKLNTRYYKDGTTEVHDFRISYPMSLSMLSMLVTVYQNKFGIESPTFEELYEYLSTGSHTYLSIEQRKMDLNKEGTKDDPLDRRLLFIRHIKYALEQSTFDQMAPEVIKENSLPSEYNVSFTCKLQFGLPTMLLLNLPIVVNNIPLPDIFFKNVNKNQIGYFPETVSYCQTEVFDNILRLQRDASSFGKTLLRFPEYDNWYPPPEIVKNEYFKPMVSAVTLIDGPTTTIDLNIDFDEYKFSPFVTDILKMHSREDIFNGTGLFMINIFSRDTPLNMSLLEYDSNNLLVTYKTDYPNTVYRIVVSECIGLKCLDIKWYPVLMKYRYYFPMTISTNINQLIRSGCMVVVPSNNLILHIDKLRKLNKFNGIVKQMIDSGYVPNGIYQFTQTTNQFANYISNTRIMTPEDFDNRDPTKTHLLPTDFFKPLDSNNSKGQLIYNKTEKDSFDKNGLVTLLDLFEYICIKNKLLPVGTKLTPLLATKEGFPYILENGDNYGFNTPFRICNYNVRVK